MTGQLSTSRSTLEDLETTDAFDVVLINVSMQGWRDIELVTDNVKRALRSGGLFVISDFPFPDSDEGLRTVPARVMTGIQYFEARIGDQLIPTQAFVDLLAARGFDAVGSFDLTPVHAVTYGSAP